jgi:multiple sugar transport system permease protein
MVIRNTSIPEKVSAVFIGLVLMFFFVIPFLWMLATSLKIDNELFEAMDVFGLFFPRQFRWRNYHEIFTQIPFFRYLLNSLLVALCSSLLETAMASLAAFGLSRMRWKAREMVRRVLFLSWMIPFSLVLIPRFLIFACLPDLLWPSDFWSSWRVIEFGGVEYPVGRLVGLDSFFALILPGSLSITATFLLITAMNRISPQLLETAYLETGSSLRVYWDIVLPLIRPSIITVAFIAFLSSWQGFTWPLIVTSTIEMQTAPVGLRAFQNLHSTQWCLLMAGSVVLTLPSLGFLFLAQRYMIDRFQLSELSESRM